MKKLTVVFVAILFCLTLFSVQVFADPGDETTTESTETTITNPEYPPPPEGYVGPWPTPDMMSSTDGSDGGTGETTDGGDEGGWIEPDV